MRSRLRGMRAMQTGVPSLETIRKLITEGRKFGTGLILISQRPSRVGETILSQCNSFLILRLVNPRDQNFVKQIMENLSEQDARMLPGLGLKKLRALVEMFLIAAEE